MEQQLTERQKRFCEEYLIDLNGAQAAIRAGYSRDSAKEIASENLTKPNIQEYLSQRQQELQEATGINQKRVLEEYAKVAFADIRNYYDENSMLLPIREIGDQAAGALAGIEVDQLWAATMAGRVQIGETKKIKVYDKVKALDSLARHLGMFGKDNEQSKPVVQITGMKVT